MEAIEKLQSAITMVNEARAVPLSASCVVHRGELLGILEEINQSGAVQLGPNCAPINFVREVSIIKPTGFPPNTIFDSKTSAIS